MFFGNAPRGGTVQPSLLQASDLFAARAWGDVWEVPFPLPFGRTWIRNEITLAHQLEHHWFGLSGQGAIAKCRAYDHSRAGVEYVTKCLTEGTFGKNEYELRKFNLSDAVTLSRSVFRVIADLERMGADSRHARVKRRGPDEGLIGVGTFCAND
jgi:hypothetical protein